MPNINLKFIVIGVVLFSILLIAGSLLFSYLGTGKSTPESKLPPKQNQEATQSSQPNLNTSASGGGSE